MKGSIKTEISIKEHLLSSLVARNKFRFLESRQTYREFYISVNSGVFSDVAVTISTDVIKLKMHIRWMGPTKPGQCDAVPLFMSPISCLFNSTIVTLVF